MTDNIYWLGHSTVKIVAEKVIYIDPWKLRDPAQKADVILISHNHFDHLSLEDIAKIRKDGTVIVTTPDGAALLSGDVRTLQPGETLAVSGLVIEAVASYNVQKEFHPSSRQWIGFILTVAGHRIYYAGDTDLIPEIRQVKADIVLVPVGGTYTMTAEEAAEAVNVIRPKVAIPIHYGDIIGSLEDARRFARLCQVPIEIKEISTALDEPSAAGPVR